MPINTLFTNYSKKTASDRYIVGFAYKKTIYSVRLSSLELLPFLSTSTASRNEGTALRFRPNIIQKKALLTMNAVSLIGQVEFENIVKSGKWNRGDIFEKILMEKAGLKWEKDNCPFWMGPDATIDGIKFQIKFEGATITNEKTLIRLTA